VRSEIHKGLTALNEQRRTQYADQITALDTAIASGSPPPNAKASADALYQNNALDQQQYAAMLSGIVRARKTNDSDAEILARGVSAFSGRTPLDPKSKDDLNAVNAVFGSLTKQAQPGSPAYSNAAIAVTQHVGIIPPDVVSWARSNLTSGSPQTAASAAGLLAHLQATNPQSFGFAVGESDKETRAMVSTINGAVQAGTDPVVAVNLARKNAQMSDSESKSLADKYQGIAKTQVDALPALLKGDPTFKQGLFSSLPAIPLAMTSDFNSLASEYYKATGGDLNQSRQLAVADLKSTWGVTEVNGKREFMQYAPEAMHPGLTTAAIRTDIDKSAAGLTADTSKVRLVQNAQTAFTNGQQWNLLAPDKFGANHILTNEQGVPLIYKLPEVRDVQAADREKSASEGMQRLRDKQAAAKASQKDAWAAADAEADAPHNHLNY